MRLTGDNPPPSSLDTAAADLVAATDVMNVLLDVRNDSDSPRAHDVLDQGLAAIGPRNLVPAEEVRVVLETVDVIERHRTGAERKDGRLRLRSLLG